MKLLWFILLVPFPKRIYFSTFDLFLLVVSQHDTLKHLFLHYIYHKPSLWLLVVTDEDLAGIIIFILWILTSISIVLCGLKEHPDDIVALVKFFFSLAGHGGI